MTKMSILGVVMNYFLKSIRITFVLIAIGAVVGMFEYGNVRWIFYNLALVSVTIGGFLWCITDNQPFVDLMDSRSAPI